jgi:hypothetical protein
MIITLFVRRNRKSKYYFLTPSPLALKKIKIFVKILYSKIFTFVTNSAGLFDSKLILVAVQTKVWICGHLLAGIASLDPSGGIDVTFL